MTIRIEIYGESASDALSELSVIAKALTGNAPIQSGRTQAVGAKIADAKQDTGSKSEPNDMQEESPASSENGSTATNGVSPSEETPAPKRRGRPKKDASAAETPAQPEVTSESVEPAGTESTSDVGASSDEDDEFAAFTAAAAKTETAPVEVPARKWTDADMGALTNQAAQKTGDAAPIKALIAEFTPDGEVPHSRNIPADRREDFAKALQARVGFEFAG